MKSFIRRNETVLDVFYYFWVSTAATTINFRQQLSSCNSRIIKTWKFHSFYFLIKNNLKTQKIIYMPQSLLQYWDDKYYFWPDLVKPHTRQTLKSSMKQKIYYLLSLEASTGCLINLDISCVKILDRWTSCMPIYNGACYLHPVMGKLGEIIVRFIGVVIIWRHNDEMWTVEFRFRLSGCLKISTDSRILHWTAAFCPVSMKCSANTVCYCHPNAVKDNAIFTIG